MNAYQYDANHNPPAPYISIRVFHPKTRASVIIAAKLDTGASRTVIPLSVVTRLGLLGEGYKWGVGFTRQPTRLPLFKIAVEVADASFENLRVFGVNRPDALLGRDILNQFDITLRGKAQVFEMKQAESFDAIGSEHE